MRALTKVAWECADQAYLGWGRRSWERASARGPWLPHLFHQRVGWTGGGYPAHPQTGARPSGSGRGCGTRDGSQRTGVQRPGRQRRGISALRSSPTSAAVRGADLTLLRWQTGIRAPFGQTRLVSSVIWPRSSCHGPRHRHECGLSPEAPMLAAWPWAQLHRARAECKAHGSLACGLMLSQRRGRACETRFTPVNGRHECTWRLLGLGPHLLLLWQPHHEP